MLGKYKHRFGILRIFYVYLLTLVYTNIYFFTTQATLMWRLIVLSLLFQSVSPAKAYPSGVQGI
jgi:hypothetical protein